MYRTKKRGWRPWLIGLGLLLVSVWLVGQMREILSPFITAAVLAYILDPLVEKLNRRGVRRGLASMLVMVFALLMLCLLLLIVVPMLVQQFGNLLTRLPDLVVFVQKKALPQLNGWLGTRWVLNEQSVTGWLYDI